MSFFERPASAKHRATGVVASAVASAKAVGPIGYPEVFADRIVEALEAQGFEIVEKAVK
ncbi:hypothetical protein R3Q06_11130 [Rhodococcus erythropolis]|uniref:hypothetical protein n=1 Tax=Rhodococcus erythropolis TaxID=1833 RepID=UPI00294A223F|nr:hypothetical protein [Rhodococcus erythropolis]MDV6274052.1 hypothetical protein [Rhodococcus erythropolis]